MIYLLFLYPDHSVYPVEKKEIHMGSYMMQAKYPEIIKELIIKAKFDITAATSLSLTEKKKACIFIFSIWLAIFK